MKEKTRGQSHDVNSLVLFEREDSQVMISGGVNSDICLYELRNEDFIQGESEKKKHLNYVQDNLVFFTKNNLIGIYHQRKASILRISQEKIDVHFSLFSHQFLNFCAYCPRYEYFISSEIENQIIKIYHATKGRIFFQIEGSFGAGVVKNSKFVCYNKGLKLIEIFDIGQGFKKVKTFSASFINIDTFQVDQHLINILSVDFINNQCFMIRIQNEEVSDLSYLLGKRNVQSVNFYN